MNEENKTNELNETKIENPMLIQAMSELKEKKNREAQEKFIEALQKATLYSPAEIGVKDEVNNEILNANDIVKGHENRVNLLAIESVEKERYIPAYTSQEEVEKGFKFDGEFVPCAFNVYVDIINNSAEELKGVVIDPYGANVILPRAFFEEIKRRANVNNNGPIMMANLEKRPAELEQALTEFFDQEGTIEKAYLQLMKRGDEISLVLIVDNKFPEGVEGDELEGLRKNLYDRIGEKVNPILKDLELGATRFCIVDLHNEVGAAMAEGREPIYTR